VPTKKAAKRQPNKKNQTSFKPGEIRNPNGRPKNADSIAVFVRTFLEEKNRRGQIIEHAFARSIDPDDPSAKQWADFLFNRAYGTPVNSIELSGKNGEPIEIKVVISSDFADDGK
jgi:cell wall assembly regulator SMI1